MRQDDFTIEGIPDGYEVREVDLTPAERSVCIVTHETDYMAPVFLLFEGSLVPVPNDAVFRVESVSHVWPPLLRCVGEERVLLHNRGVERGGKETNAYILSRAGHLERSFNIGGPSEVLVSENWIVTHYSDQAMTSDDHPVDREGLAVFDASGTLLWGFESHFAGKPRLGVFFHAAAWVGTDEIAVYRDVERPLNTLEAFILVDLRNRSQQFWPVPQQAHFSTALTVIGDRVMFHGFSGGIPIWGIPPSLPGILHWLMVKMGRASPPPGEGDIVEWEIGSDHCRVIGHYPSLGSLRGLPGGRFIAAKRDGYTILSFD